MWKLYIVALACFLLLGCGGNTGCTDSSGNGDGGFVELEDLPIIINPQTIVIPNDGSVQVIFEDDESIEMSGALPPIVIGDVIVTPGAKSSIRKVLAVSDGGSSVSFITEYGLPDDAYLQGTIKGDIPFFDGGMEFEDIPGVMTTWLPPAPGRDIDFESGTLVFSKSDEVQGYEFELKFTFERLPGFDDYVQLNWGEEDLSKPRFFAGFRIRVELDGEITSEHVTEITNKFFESKVFLVRFGTFPFFLAGKMELQQKLIAKLVAEVAVQKEIVYDVQVVRNADETWNNRIQKVSGGSSSGTTPPITGEITVEVAQVLPNVKLILSPYTFSELLPKVSFEAWLKMEYLTGCSIPDFVSGRRNETINVKALVGVNLAPGSLLKELGVEPEADSKEFVLLTGERSVVAGCRGATDVFSDNFNSAPKPGWSNTMVAVPPSGNRFLGQFGNQSVGLSLADMVSHTKLTISFDLHIIQTWDGSSVNGPDTFSISVDGTSVGSWTFSNTTGSLQSYPVAGSVRGTGAVTTNQLGYTPVFGPSWANSTYRLSLQVNHTGSSGTILFQGSSLEPIINESWGIDNVAVTIQ